MRYWLKPRLKKNKFRRYVNLQFKLVPFASKGRIKERRDEIGTGEKVRSHPSRLSPSVKRENPNLLSNCSSAPSRSFCFDLDLDSLR